MKKTRKTGCNQKEWEKTRTARWTLEEKILGQRSGHMMENTRTTRWTQVEKRLEYRGGQMKGKD